MADYRKKPATQINRRRTTGKSIAERLLWGPAGRHQEAIKADEDRGGHLREGNNIVDGVSCASPQSESGAAPASSSSDSQSGGDDPPLWTGQTGEIGLTLLFGLTVLVYLYVVVVARMSFKNEIHPACCGATYKPSSESGLVPSLESIQIDGIADKPQCNFVRVVLCGVPVGFVDSYQYRDYREVGASVGRREAESADLHHRSPA